VGFVVDKVTMGRVFSKYISFPYTTFHQLLHTHYNPSSRAGTIGQIVTDIPSGIRLTPPQETYNNRPVLEAIKPEPTNSSNYIGCPKQMNFKVK
jgi:hypothetical protein